MWRNYGGSGGRVLSIEKEENPNTQNAYGINDRADSQGGWSELTC